MKRLKEVYLFHPETKEYVGAGFADESPLEPGVYLLPAHSTELAPPMKRKDTVYVFNGESWQSKTVTPPVKAEVDVKAELSKAAINKRDGLLQASDWTMLPDVDHGSQKRFDEWKDYRQALRDLPSQKGFPEDIYWPVKPK